MLITGRTEAVLTKGRILAVNTSKDALLSNKQKTMQSDALGWHIYILPISAAVMLIHKIRFQKLMR